jgi:hypothetical protein
MVGGRPKFCSSRSSTDGEAPDLFLAEALCTGHHRDHDRAPVRLARVDRERLG